jgi:putative IMPACT (imprinted ancient) family translation regulator
LEYNDTYQTIAFESEEILFKEKGSKFFGYAFPIENEDEVKPIIENLKKTASSRRSLLLCIPIGNSSKNILSSQ